MDGYLPLPTAPGLGIELDEDALADKIDHDWQNREGLRRGRLGDRLVAWKNWFDRPMRWGQLTLAENDPGQFDPRFWLDYFQRCHCDAVCLSAGGIVAYYPDPDPAPPSERLARRPRLRSASLPPAAGRWGWSSSPGPTPTRCGTRSDEAHPDWIQSPRTVSRADTGRTRPLGDLPARPLQLRVHDRGPPRDRRALPCRRHLRQPLGGPRRSATASAAEAGSGRRPARSCRAPRIPPTRRIQPIVDWRHRRLLDLWRLWDGEIRAINPERPLHPERLPRPRRARRAGRHLHCRPPGTVGPDAALGQRPGREADSRRDGPEADRRHLQPGHLAPDLPLDGLGQLRGRDRGSGHSRASPHGFRPWFTKFSGTIRDPRWLGSRRADLPAGTTEPSAISGTRSRSPASASSTPRRPSASTAAGRSTPSYHKLGMYQALLEARVPFDMVNDRLLDPERIDRYRLLVLPNVACLSRRSSASSFATTSRAAEASSRRSRPRSTTSAGSAGPTSALPTSSASRLRHGRGRSAR